jgi:hypothetical protein
MTSEGGIIPLRSKEGDDMGRTYYTPLVRRQCQMGLSSALPLGP